jgi:hypothetical protein
MIRRNKENLDLPELTSEYSKRAARVAQIIIEKGISVERSAERLAESAERNDVPSSSFSNGLLPAEHGEPVYSRSDNGREKALSFRVPARGRRRDDSKITITQKSGVTGRPKETEIAREDGSKYGVARRHRITSHNIKKRKLGLGVEHTTADTEKVGIEHPRKEGEPMPSARADLFRTLNRARAEVSRRRVRVNEERVAQDDRIRNKGRK